MSDLPPPQDAAEAALFAECWDAVLSYADLCTAGAGTAHQLADEAFTLGMRELRAAQSAVRGRTARLPVIPQLLTAVRETVVDWESAGKGHKLDPDLRLWLNSEAAARYTGPPLGRPIALRGLRDMPEADATLLWLAEVEALPLPTVARRLGLDPLTTAAELDQVRVLFHDRCHRAHRDTPLDAECRSYARLLDAVTRSPGADTPEDLSRHLATCVPCAEAAACLRLHGGGVPAALAGGVIGWGALAYLERRRRAAEVRLGMGGPAGSGTGPDDEAARGRVLRGSLLAAAGLLSAVALGVSLMPFGTSGDDAPGRDDQKPIAAPDVPHPTPAPSRSSRSAAPATTRTLPVSPSPKPTPTPRKSPPSSRKPSATPSQAPEPSTPPTCQVSYHLDDEWSDGFQASLHITTEEPLSGWQLAWTFPDGQHIGQTWDATPHQNGAQVTAEAKDYNREVAAHGTIAFGFVGTRDGGNGAPQGFRLNGEPCATS
ncbi:cellulose binding domain-containing protein [Streptomyces sp. NBC_00566]|uniref:cellulose binding domain-containing protein n=1 Tax=Streptomyces sp. NBC_00566 TaxID=2975778 RepID=UPI002E811CC9|nr:cellulose binding domain-containing protein [Streptomyces sp. NBC_00566]WUB86144.1 cellulose binding domain-containing protein [Streptomyces sp. NBC_00566]